MIGFLDLPGEIRNLIYDHPLMFQEPIVPWAKEQALPISLFYTNKTIYREFCSLFYSRITFNFTSHELGHEEHQCPARLTKQVTSFLDQIGQNAKYIESIKPDFPRMFGDEEHIISRHSTQIVDKIWSICPNLKELTVGLFHTFNLILHTVLNDLEDAVDLMSIVDDHFGQSRRSSRLRSNFLIMTSTMT